MQTDYKIGLIQSEVLERQKKWGRNEIVEHTTSSLLRILKKFTGPIPIMIEVALLLSGVLGKWEEFSIILILLIVNVGVDFIQEEKAGRALAELKATLARTALVLRDGVFSKIEATDLVPGDIVKLTIGSIVPADVVLRAGMYLEVDQSALTGESLPVDKQIGEVVYGNAVVRKGEMLAEVQYIGSSTYIGRSTKLVQKTIDTEGSHFEKAIISIGNFLILFALVLVLIIVIVSILRGDSLVETIRFALILSVASIPVALPAVLSVTMAVGALSIARKHAIVSNLKAIEELAGIDILCADKTGTLTKNEMKVESVECFNGHTEGLLVTYSLLASEEENSDAIELPIFQYAKEHGYYGIHDTYQKLNFVPFDPVRKYVEVTVEKDGTSLEIVKGSAQAIIQLIRSDSDSQILSDRVNYYAEKGYRTLAVAVKRVDEEHYTLVGLIPMFDPARDDSALMVKAIQQAGIKIKMLTGDSVEIARHIASILGIGSNIKSADTLRKLQEGETDGVYKGDLTQVDGFAGVFPEDKYLLVEALQKKDIL